ncbi:MAG TPA: zinc ribbon domain-containing protein [Virgibacillus sp.]|nr:zinc ribbon domain-containing protein [Virgibacillus sp.]
MHYCPYCGIKTKEDELYCFKCGKELPDDLNKRLKPKKYFNRFWYIPITLFILFSVTSGVHFLILQYKDSHAKELYQVGEMKLEDEKYKEARDLFKRALNQKKDFYNANVSMTFTNNVLQIQREFDEAIVQLDAKNLDDALAIVNDTDQLLKNFHGPAATPIVKQMDELRNKIKIEQINKRLADEPSIDDYKTLLWEAESIKTNEANEVRDLIRKEIINYTHSKASEQLNKKQFNNALNLVEDGLKYATDSDKLQSLKTTIDKEKTAFETAEQQRIEQAVDVATEERELNEQDAVKLDNVKTSKDDQDNLVVQGKVSSIATIPVNSVLIEYSLLTKKGKTILTNKVFVYPDKLYPDETGKFEFTHYDMKNKKAKDVEVNVDKITWYTD